MTKNNSSSSMSGTRTKVNGLQASSKGAEQSAPTNLGELFQKHSKIDKIVPHLYSDLWDDIRALLQLRIQHIEVAKEMTNNKNHKVAFGYAILELKDLGGDIL